MRGGAVCAVLWLVGCGKETPCVGAQCLPVSGTYTGRLQSASSGCTEIGYGSGGYGTSGDFGSEVAFTVSQDGSELTLTWVVGMQFQLNGVLYGSGASHFHTHVRDQVIGGLSARYAIDDTEDLTFTTVDGGVAVTGHVADTLTAQTRVEADASCSHALTLTADRL
jgi:hypothetical protein